MHIRFSLSTGEPLPFSEGLTADYNGTVLRGSIQSHTYSSLGNINLQAYGDEFDIIRKLTVNWTTPQRLLCEYAEADYTNFSNFSKAFLKQCSCTPAELRQDKWDIDALPNYNRGANEG